MQNVSRSIMQEYFSKYSKECYLLWTRNNSHGKQIHLNIWWIFFPSVFTSLFKIWDQVEITWAALLRIFSENSLVWIKVAAASWKCISKNVTTTACKLIQSRVKTDERPNIPNIRQFFFLFVSSFSFIYITFEKEETKKHIIITQIN